ncbi:MAG: Na(+)/H(+) antiporter subunit B [Bacteroidales bacterium]|nr:Na(+)/H(+) antiporter subunit B [Bacteroidales bacterium]
MKKFFVIALLAILGFYLTIAFLQIPFGQNRLGQPQDEATVGAYYLNNTKEKSAVSNVVTAIVVNYRGFDTLGEVTVLFLASTGLASILYRRKEEEVERINKPSSSLLQTGSKFLFPLVVLLGIYVFIHGHLTPGGGFQGGAIIATGFLLMLIAYQKYHVSHSMLTWVESLAGVLFVSIGLWGLITGGTFLENSYFPKGVLNSLISGGAIPIIYIAVGFKVAAELTGVLDILLNTKEEKSVPSNQNEK